MANNQIGLNGFNILPKGVKNLLIINVLVFFATVVFAKTGICDLNKWLGLHYFKAPDFHMWQFITYMFMHGNFGHIFFNMFALWMFGAAVENYWGTKKFLIYYLVTGIGAALTHYLITFVEIHSAMALFDQFLDAPSLETYRYLVENNQITQLQGALQNNYNVLLQQPDQLNELVAATISIEDSYLNSFLLIGASGAIYGILLAFGFLFPNSPIYIYFLFPIKAKWFVVIFGILLIWLWHRHDKLGQEQTYYQFNGTRDSGRQSNWQFWKKEGVSDRKSKYYVSRESGRPLSDEDFNARRQAEKERIDEILDKISKSGYDALSKEEKDLLFHYSQK